MNKNTGIQKRTYQYSDNVKIYYEVHGRGDTKILFIHGYGSSHLTWYDIKDNFKSSFELYFVDLKGFGNATRSRDNKYSPTDHAEIVISIIEHLNLKRIILAGHSYGGGIALLTYLKLLEMHKGDFISKIIIIDAVVHIEKLPMLIFRSKEPFLKYILLKFVPSSTIAKIALDRMFVNKEAITKKRIDNYAKFMKPNGSEHSYVETARKMYPELKNLVVPNLDKIKVETLIIWGKEDPLIPIEHAKYLNSEIKNSQLKIVNNCGHAPQEERPELTSELIKNFCNNQYDT